MKQLLECLLDKKRLERKDLLRVFSAMFTGDLDPHQLAAFLAGFRLQGERQEELYAGASTMRQFAITPKVKASCRPLTDNCGTGGDHSGSFNISTAAAIIAASCGVRIAKHGNRSVSSQCGSADLLFAAGFPAEIQSEQAVALLESTGFTFFFAPTFHPAMKSIMPVRKGLGVRTIFNFLGPLANPLMPEFQLVGVGAKNLLEPMADTLQELGTQRILVVHSQDGMDEISSAAKTDAVEIINGKKRSIVIDPKVHGIHGRAGDCTGGDATFNLEILNKILLGIAVPQLQATLINAGAVLWISKHSEDLTTGISAARMAIEDGTAGTFFRIWIDKAKEIFQRV
jgi:anthranilate phosphoribosyltransferase